MSFVLSNVQFLHSDGSTLAHNDARNASGGEVDFGLKTAMNLGREAHFDVPSIG